jgi:hypothetical protein
VQGLKVVREDLCNHQADDLTRREVLARILVHRLVELPDQLLEYVAHLQVRDVVRMEVDVLLQSWGARFSSFLLSFA